MEQGTGPGQPFLQHAPDNWNLQQDTACHREDSFFQAAFLPAGFRQLCQILRSPAGNGIRCGILMLYLACSAD